MNFNKAGREGNDCVSRWVKENSHGENFLSARSELRAGSDDAVESVRPPRETTLVRLLNSLFEKCSPCVSAISACCSEFYRSSKVLDRALIENRFGSRDIAP